MQIDSVRFPESKKLIEIEEITDDLDIRDAFVKYSPKLTFEESKVFDANNAKENLLRMGAFRVVVSPVIGEVLRNTEQLNPQLSVMEISEQYFENLLSDLEDRKSCIDLLKKYLV